MAPRVDGCVPAGAPAQSRSAGSSFKEALGQAPSRRAGASPSLTSPGPGAGGRSAPLPPASSSAGRAGAGPTRSPAGSAPPPARGAPAGGGPTVASPASVGAQHTAAAAQLSTARAHHVATARDLATARASHHQTHEQQATHRLVDLIASELACEPSPVSAARAGHATPAPAAAPQHLPFEPLPTSQLAVGAQRSSGPMPPALPAERAAQAVALVERIETFVRSARPALALTLHQSLGARVEVEKLGPGRVALRLVGHRGPPSPETVARIREALRSRGLEVGAVSVA
jgi:hypothetical protein